MRRSKVLGLVAMALMLSSVLFPAATSARESTASTEDVSVAVTTMGYFYFRAGRDSSGQLLYFESLRACGYNSSNAYVCWTTKYYSPYTRNADSISGQGLQPSRGIAFSFYLSGYGNRSCTVYPQSTNNYNVDYKGNYACTSSAF